MSILPSEASKRVSVNVYPNTQALTALDTLAHALHGVVTAQAFMTAVNVLIMPFFTTPGLIALLITRQPIPFTSSVSATKSGAAVNVSITQVTAGQLVLPAGDQQPTSAPNADKMRIVTKHSSESASVKMNGLDKIIVTVILAHVIILAQMQMVAMVQTVRTAKSALRTLIGISTATVFVTRTGREMSVNSILDHVRQIV